MKQRRVRLWTQPQGWKSLQGMARATLATRAATSVLFVTSVLTAGPMPQQVERYQPTVIVDPNGLSDQERAKVLVAASASLPSDSWREVQVKQGDTLLGIINAQYRYYDSVYPLTASAIANLVSSANEIRDIDVLQADAVIKLPVLPVRPYTRGSQVTITQALEVQDGNATLKTIDFEPLPRGRGDRQRDLPTGGLWEFSVGPEVADKIQRAAVENGGDSAAAVFTSPELFTAPVRFPDSTLEGVPEVVRHHLAVQPVETSYDLHDIAVAERYFVLDFFGPDVGVGCEHGEKVVAVARAVLRQAGATNLAPLVVAYNLDFYADRERSKTIIDAFLARECTKGTRLRLEKTRDALLKEKRPINTPYAVPLFFLQAILSNMAADPSVSVVSTSLFAEVDGYQAIPRNYRPDGRKTFLTAVLDVPNAYVEDTTAAEPIRSYWLGRRDLGFVLVGGFGRDMAAFGMVSRTGDGITSLGPAADWEAASQCIAASEAGTSFATPAIGATIFLAKAVWQRSGFRPSAKEVARRLALSAIIEPLLVRRAAGPGALDLRRLIKATGALVARVGGGIEEVSGVQGELRFVDEDGQQEVTQFGAAANAASGFQLAGGRSFLFRSAVGRWEEVEVINIHVEFRCGDEGVVLESRYEFEQLYSALLVFSAGG
jgi:hypothetical protein